jgi:hypothetical protein
MAGSCWTRCAAACSGGYRARRGTRADTRCCTLRQQLEEIFGTSDTNSGARDLSPSEFLSSLNQSQAKQLRMKAAATAAKPGVKPGAASGSAAGAKRPGQR